ncbi:peptide/nickel transport system substrate-binding protein [Labrenzia sp. MBR-25]|jgi:peptide/nickel transport system substrate-binding protein
MNITRRRLMQTSAAFASLTCGGSLSFAEAKTGGKTIRAVMHADLRSFDPVWTTATITGYHSGMIYDTLFGIDEQGVVRPQMVADYSASENGLHYSFTLRDGLSFSDGSPVTARDCVASMKRWAARDTAGQLMFSFVTDTPVVSDKTFEIHMDTPYGLVLETLGKTSNCLWIMREKEALTPPNEQVAEYIGSGPFTFNREETKLGASYVYDRNPNYVPRPEPASGTTGGKVVKVDRVIWENISDPQTAIGALQSGEIDFYETPPLELLSQLESDSNLRIKVINETGIIGFVRLNWLHPPFDNKKARQAMLYVVNQLDIMRAAYGDDRYFNACDSLFGCGTNMENQENTDWFKHGQDFDKARQLFKEAGYDGRPVVILQGTTLPMPNMAAQLIAQWLQKAGVNAELAPSDWGGVVSRRAVQDPPEKGGWNIFITYNPTSTFASPILFPGHLANGTKGFFGWPDIARWEELRRDWTLARNQDERFEIAKEMQRLGWDEVPHVLGGQWRNPVAMRSNVHDFPIIPDLLGFWNVEKD